LEVPGVATHQVHFARDVAKPGGTAGVSVSLIGCAIADFHARLCSEGEKPFRLTSHAEDGQFSNTPW
jgi:hypothetical protein